MKKLTKKQNAMILSTKKALIATGDPGNIIVAKNLRGGLQVVNYLFDAQKVAEKTIPQGYELEPLTLSAKTTKAMGHSVAAQWLIVAMMEALHRNELRKNATQTAVRTTPAARSKV